MECSDFRIDAILRVSGGRYTKAPGKENTQMHDLLIALSFVAMVLAPCFVASKSGAAEMDSETV